jgi:ATP-dependent DNA ligase
MKTLADAILEARKHSTKKEKYAALGGLNAADQKLLFETFNPYRVFGIRKYDVPAHYAVVDPMFGYASFFKLLDSLADRTLTGNAAKEAVTKTLSQYTAHTAAALRLVLNKDLDCGANRDTFEKIYPSLGIPQFDQMLCQKIEHVKNAKGEIVYPKYQWVFPCLGEVKYDGYRLIAMVKNGATEYLSRGGKPADQWQGLFDDELAKMEKAVGAPIVVDGEILAEGYQGTAKAKGSKNDKSGLRFFAFDFMLLSDWIAQRCTIPQLHRTSELTKLIKDLGLTKVIKSKAKILHNLEEAKAFYTEVIEQGLPGQDEGLIIKQLNGLYEWTAKRTVTWAKWKPVIDVDVTVVGFYEGSGKNEGKLGGFYVEGEDENGNKIKSKCGGYKVGSKKFKDWFAVFAKKHHIDLSTVTNNMDGFFRSYVWNHQHLFLKKTCMIETQELTQAQGSATYALRFPFFVMMRDDK